jgi:hypothetical protein
MVMHLVEELAPKDTGMGMGGDMPSFMDPSKMNEEMMMKLVPFIEEVTNDSHGFRSMEDAFTYIDTLGNRLMDLGLAQEEVDMLRGALEKRRGDI